MNFNSISFGRNKFGFDNVSLGGRTYDFKEAIFAGRANFAGLICTKEVNALSFRHASFGGAFTLGSEDTFGCVPDLVGTETCHHTSLAGLKCVFPTKLNSFRYRQAKDKGDVERLRRLKELAKQNRDFETKIKSLEAQVSTLEKKAASKSKTLEIDLAAKTAELLQEIENRSKAEQDVLDKTAEIEAFVDEIESLATMADDATGQCDEILKKLSTTEDEVVNLQKETAAARREAKKYYDDYEQVRMSNEKDKAEALSALERLQLLTEDVEKLTKELESAKAEARGVTGACSSDRIKIEQLEADITRLNSQLSIVEKRCNQLSLDEVKIQKELKKLTEERDALKIDQAGLKKKCDRLSREGGAGLMQDEINAYKTMLGCHVCKQRDKACVITKCFHMFCRECIDTRIATRQRKCPGCALPFSETDVQNIYF